VGKEYAGMTMNPDQRTIQGELERALFKAGCISESNFGFPNKYGWSNAARTDKGVHSCAQVCSGKLLVDESENYDAERERINHFLPSDIRVLDVMKTTRTFTAKTSRDRVRYTYMLPTYSFYDRQKMRQIFIDLKSHENGRHASDPLSQEETEAAMNQLKSYRVTKEQLSEFRETLSLFEGTHSFHSYTNGRKPSDPSCKRYILSFIAHDPVISEDGTEWVVTEVIGQSFLLHHIRKMINMAIEVTRGAANRNTILNSFSRKRIMNTSISPPHGLFLDMSYYDSFNKFKGKFIDAPLDWENNQVVKQFKRDIIMPHIMNEESKEGNYVKYLFVQEFKFDRSNYDVVDEDDDMKEEQDQEQGEEQLQEQGENQ